MAIYVGNTKICDGLSSGSTGSTEVTAIAREILPNVVLFGDSITDTNANGEWVKVIENYASFKSLNNYARGFATWCFKSDSSYNITDLSDQNIGNNVVWNQYNRMVNDINNGTIEVPDCIVILAGTNDALQNLTQGTPSEVIGGTYQSEDITTLTNISASIRYVVELIYNEYPNCQVILATPLQAKSKQTTAKVKTVHDTIISCANLLGTKVIDQTYCSGIYQFREYVNNTFLKDDVHLKPEGGELVAKFLAREFYNKINARGEGGGEPITPTKTLDSITAQFNQGSNTVYNTDELQVLKQYLTVTGNYSDGSTSAVTNYTLSGNLNVGTSTITVNASGKTATFTVNVTQNTQTTYTITNNLTNVTNSNSQSSVVENSSYSATLSANTNYEIASVTITMGGSDITSSSYSNGNITINSVTGNVVITASANMVQQPDVYGDIITNSVSISIFEEETFSLNVTLSQAPTNNQIVNLSINNGAATIDKTSLTFTPSNYNVAQKVTINGVTNGNAILTITSNNVSNKVVSITIKAPSSYTSFALKDSSSQSRNTHFLNLVSESDIDTSRKCYLAEISGSDSVIGINNGDGTYSFDLASTNANMYSGPVVNTTAALNVQTEYFENNITIPLGSYIRLQYDYTKASTTASRLNIYSKDNSGTETNNQYKNLSTTEGTDGLNLTATTSHQHSYSFKASTGEDVSVSNFMIATKPSGTVGNFTYVEGQYDKITITIPTQIEQGDVFAYSSTHGKWIVTKADSSIVETDYTEENAFQLKTYATDMNVLVSGEFKPTSIKVNIPIQS